MDNEPITSQAITTEPQQNTPEEIKSEDVAYVIEDKHLPPITVRKTHNAWWSDKRKVEKLIEAFKYGATIKEACAYAVIEVYQYKYFVELHPEFSTIKDACLLRLNLIARKTIVGNLEKPEGAYFWAQTKMRDEFGKDTQDPGNSAVARILDVIINQKEVRVSERMMNVIKEKQAVVEPVEVPNQELNGTGQSDNGLSN